MKHHYYINSFRIVFILVLSFLLSCAEVEKKPVVVSPPIAEKEIKSPALAIKRQIKDIDFKSRLEEKGPKKRLVILPFLDLSPDRPESARRSARDAFMDEINKSEEVIAIDSNQLKVDPATYVSSGEYNFSKLVPDMQTAGVSSVLEGKILDLRMKKTSEKKAANTIHKANFEAVVRIRVVNVRSGKELFHTVKTVTIEDSESHVADNVTEDKFFEKNPDLVSVLIKDAFLDFTPQVISSMNEVSWEGRIAALKGEKCDYHLLPNVANKTGKGTGELVGGNLTLFANGIGTSSDVNTKNCILFLEDLDEQLYHIDRMFIQLKRSGKLKKLNGLIIGGFTDLKDTERPFGKNIVEIVSELVAEYNYPVCFDFPVSHGDDNVALKHGMKHKLIVEAEGVLLKEM